MAERLIDFYSTHPQYDDHMRPIWDALGSRRGDWWQTGRLPPASDRLTLVSSYGNLFECRRARRRIAYMEHGIGISYRGTLGQPFVGGKDRDGVTVFLDPNWRARDTNQQAHPNIPGHIVGTPKLDGWWTLPPREPGSTVCFSWHWDYKSVPETRWSFPYYQRELIRLKRIERHLPFRIVGHAHPRIHVRMKAFYARLRIPYIQRFADVPDQADLYVCDNSSTLYEFAALGRPVLVLNSPHYRRHFHHGLRFWEHVPGLQCDRPGDLRGMIELALSDPPEAQRLRREAVEHVYPYRDGRDARRAADTLIRYA